MTRYILAVLCVVPALMLSAGVSREFKLTADRIAVDNVTKAAIATGRVEAVSEPLHIRGVCAHRDANGVTRFDDPTDLTTCTNAPGICHWSLSGEVEYLNGKYVSGRNVWLRFYEIPVFWIPYFKYPLDFQHIVQIMPGYMRRWGAYVMTKVNYQLAGDPLHGEESFWLSGNTRLDWRYENGVALGEGLRWGLGSLGEGYFKVYYAWDEDYKDYDRKWSSRHYNYRNWGSEVNYDRYLIELAHRWEPTERDIVRVKGQISSDTYFRRDFMRNQFLTLANDWMGDDGNELAWEHNEAAYGLGVSVTGPLTEFGGGVARLPEFYFDIAPQPVMSLPVNYESESRVGYLRRKNAEYGDGDRTNPFAFGPGQWADYDTVRLDTYHRLTAPVKFADVLSVVPRLAYHGTYWSETGSTDLGGWGHATDRGESYRSILESGVTFAGRGKAWLSPTWQHMMEPYFDVLAQKAWYGSLTSGSRPYVFDSIDASVDWQDQFAGRGRSLPYTYYGVTPGFRNAFDRLDENGHLTTVFDIDAYVALQFEPTDWYGDDPYHKLARAGRPNYGKRDIYAMPGVRVRWFPRDDIVLRAQVEYDVDNDKIALADLEWRQRVSSAWSYYVSYSARDHRLWDFSSTPYDAEQMTSDDLNWLHYNYVELGCENHPIDWFAWSPFIRWDCRENEVDGVGAWFDYLTDCLGFRWIVAYQNAYTRIDRSERGDDFHVGFFIYLRAFGANNANPFH